MQTQTNPAEESLNQVVGQFRGEPVTRRQYQAAFHRVCAPHWKDPIRKTIDLIGSDPDGEIELITDAVVFFTGSVPTFERIGATRRYKVRAAGYYRTIGA